MAFEELKVRQSKMWGSGPYEEFPEHYRELFEDLVDRLGVKPGERWLDVGTGTGALATLAARAGADVTGVDLAPALIERAQRFAEADGLAIRYDVGDAENLPYDDASFDVVASSVGTIFAPDHEAVARELARVCRPGGRLGLGCWDPKRGVVDMFKVMAPFMPAPPPGAGSPFAWGDPEHARALLSDAFDLEFVTGDAPQRGASGEEVWRLFSTQYGPTRTLADSLEPERREELHRSFVEFFEGHRTGSGIVNSRPYLLVLGTRR